MCLADQVFSNDVRWQNEYVMRVNYDGLRGKKGSKGRRYITKEVFPFEFQWVISICNFFIFEIYIRQL